MLWLMALSGQYQPRHKVKTRGSMTPGPFLETQHWLIKPVDPLVG